MKSLLVGNFLPPAKNTLALLKKAMRCRGSLLILLSLALTACATFPNYQQPRVYLTNLQLQQAGLFAQTFLLYLRVDNPNDTAISLNGIDVSISLNGHSLAQGLSNQLVSIPRFGSAAIKVQATTTLISLVQQVLSLQNKSKLTYEIAGRLYLDRTLGFNRSSFPFQEEGVLDMGALLNRNPADELVPRRP